MKIPRRISMLFLILVLILAIPVSTNAATVKLNKTKLTLSVGKTYQLVLKNTNKTVKWRSADKSVATVTKKGKVRAKKAGSTKIIASINTKKFVCKLTVKAASGGKSGNSSGNASGGTVYWTPSGSVYHYSRNCSTLSRSRTVNSGSIAESGKPRGCKVCG